MHDLANSADEHHAAVNFLLHQDDKGATAQKNADRDHMLKIANRLAAGGYGSNHGKRSVVRFGIRFPRGFFFPTMATSVLPSRQWANDVGKKRHCQTLRAWLSRVPSRWATCLFGNQCRRLHGEAHPLVIVLARLLRWDFRRSAGSPGPPRSSADCDCCAVPTAALLFQGLLMLLMGWTSSTCVTTYVEKLLEQRVAFEDMARFARLRLAESLLRSIFCQTAHLMLGGVCSMPAGKAVSLFTVQTAEGATGPRRRTCHRCFFFLSQVVLEAHCSRECGDPVSLTRNISRRRTHRKFGGPRPRC